MEVHLTSIGYRQWEVVADKITNRLAGGKCVGACRFILEPILTRTMFARTALAGCVFYTDSMSVCVYLYCFGGLRGQSSVFMIFVLASLSLLRPKFPGRSLFAVCLVVWYFVLSAIY